MEDVKYKYGDSSAKETDKQPITADSDIRQRYNKQAAVYKHQDMRSLKARLGTTTSGVPPEPLGVKSGEEYLLSKYGKKPTKKDSLPLVNPVQKLKGKKTRLKPVVVLLLF